MQVKICGLKSREALEQVKQCGADIAGFVFAKGRRQISIKQAAELSRGIDGILKAGIFVNAAEAFIAEAVRECGLDYIQLHGDESPELATRLKDELGVKVIKAFRYQPGFNGEVANEYPADMVIVDTYSKAAYGGTGKSFDLAAARPELIKITKPLLIAGGISRANVGLVKSLMPKAGVDVSSGVEINGEKSLALIAEFMQYVGELEREDK